MTRNPVGRCLPKRGLCLAVALLLALAPAAWAQVNPPARPAEVPQESTVTDDATGSVFLPADRRTLQDLTAAKRLLSEGRFGEAVRYLGAILEAPEDFFFRSKPGTPISRSLKAEAQRLLGQMPRAGRELYELQYGAQARQMLAEALRSGDMAAVAEVSRRFFHTRSGCEATFLVGLDHFEHGRPLAAALCLQRLQEAAEEADELEPALSLTTAACWLQGGSPEKARDTLTSLRQRHPALRVAVAGREVPIFSNDEEAIDWLVGLIGPTPAATQVGSLADVSRRCGPQRGHGRRSTPVKHAVASGRDGRSADGIGGGAVPAAVDRAGSADHSTLCPLAVADVLLMRTVGNLLAVDLSTGKRLWETAEGDDVERWPSASALGMQIRQSLLREGIRQRMWDDMTYGTLSSDGRCVFAVEDSPQLGRARWRAARASAGRNAKPRGNGRRTDFTLQPAGGVRHSQRRTQVEHRRPGRAKRAAASRNLLPRSPLPLMGQLYVLGEIKGEVRLMALDGATGNLPWSQQLAVAEQSVAQDPLRRWAGASPSYADGVLVCPTVDRRDCGRGVGHAIAVVGISVRPRPDRRPGAASFNRRSTLRVRRPRAGSTAASRSPTAACWPRRSNPILCIA